MKRAAIRLALLGSAAFIIGAAAAVSVVVFGAYEDPWGDCDD